MKQDHPRTTYLRYPSPCGELILGARAGRLVCCDWREAWQADHAHQALPDLFADEGEATGCKVLAVAVEQLEAYLRGERQTFDLPLLATGTPFQEAVWQGLREIPYGQTLSYGGLAGRLGRPQASRAVGRAAGANRLAIFIPCHRLIGQRGELTGFRGGREAKRYLLEIEQGIGGDLPTDLFADGKL